MDFLSVAGFALNLYSYFQEHPLEETVNQSPVPVERTVVQPAPISPYPLRKIPVSELLQNSVAHKEENRVPSLAEGEGQPEPASMVKQNSNKAANKRLMIARKRHESESGVDNNGLYFLRRKAATRTE
ncbi:MAG: hypothetical protein HN842_10035 [Gammaproteobacteria bacterium]|jgi:hypothetical protein|nr:hypothetical protein [Gammaproteobacteria bacterium]